MKIAASHLKSITFLYMVEGNALSYFNVMIAINLHCISVTMKLKHVELVLQVSEKITMFCGLSQ